MASREVSYQGTISAGPGRWAKGLIVFASIMLVIVGTFHAIAGLSAILDDSFYTVAGNYTLEVDLTTWGWVHFIGGIAFVAAGFFLLSGNLLARIIAVFAAMVSAGASFWSIPYYPIWSIVILALDVAVIWAVDAHGQELSDSRF